jgi:DNA-binding response OmpR family regulator
MKTANNKPIKILIAEDERDIRELVGFTLTFGGYQVVEAPDGKAAVEKALAELPDLIILDVRMPKMTGYEACQALKALKETQRIPVVFLSAKGQEIEVKQGIDLGAVAYILKPFAPNELLDQVARILKSTTETGG